MIHFQEDDSASGGTVFSGTNTVFQFEKASDSWYINRIVFGIKGIFVRIRNDSMNRGILKRTTSRSLLMSDTHTAILLSSRSKIQQIGGILSLTIAAMIWGLAFAAQRQGAEFVSPLVFLAIRSWIGIAALFPVCLILDKANGRKPAFFGAAHTRKEIKWLLTGGLCCGAVVFLASILQQWGLEYSSAGKAGFLTALYIVIVPLLGLFFKRKVTWLLWLAVFMVVIGSYLLCASEGFGAMNLGDVLLFLCAFCYAAHIMVVDHFSKTTDCVRLSCLQFFATAVLSTLGAVIAGNSWDIASIQKAAAALLFCGIGSTGIAYTLQIVGQKYVHPVAASLLMCMESVFSVLGGWLFLNEKLTLPELFGCAIIFTAVLLAQIPLPSSKR